MGEQNGYREGCIVELEDVDVYMCVSLLHKPYMLCG